MKIVVFSDSHGMYNSMIDIVNSEEPNMVIHCGDFNRDADHLRRTFRTLEIHSVVGNCDYGDRSDTEDLFEVRGKRFYVTHGHLHGVKRDYTSLIYSAREKEADVAICGHTHVPLFEKHDGLYVINPGSITFGGKTYGVIEITENSFDYTCKTTGRVRGAGRR